MQPQKHLKGGWVKGEGQSQSKRENNTYGGDKDGRSAECGDLDTLHSRVKIISLKQDVAVCYLLVHCIF